MIIELDNSKTTEFILDNYDDLGATIKRATLYKNMGGWEQSKNINVINNGGEWFCFAIALTNFGKLTLVRADSFQEAFDFFLDQFTSDHPESEKDKELGHWVDSKWFSEDTIARVLQYQPDRIELEVSL